MTWIIWFVIGYTLGYIHTRHGSVSNLIAKGLKK